MLFRSIAAGAAIGLVYAPRPGARTRRALARNTRQAQRFLENQANEIRQNLEATLKQGRRTIERSASKIADAMELGRKAVGA